MALGSPPEVDEDGNNQWDGKNGVIQQLKQLCNMKNWRARRVIRGVLKRVRSAIDNGGDAESFDAGQREHGTNSGR